MISTIQADQYLCDTIRPISNQLIKEGEYTNDNTVKFLRFYYNCTKVKLVSHFLADLTIRRKCILFYLMDIRSLYRDWLRKLDISTLKLYSKSIQNKIGFILSFYCSKHIL